MDKAEFKSERTRRGMSQAEFGAWLSAELGRTRSYTVSEVSNWETGQRAVPAAIEVVLLRNRLRALGQDA